MNGGLISLDVMKQVDEAYELIKKWYNDISSARQHLANRDVKNLLIAYKKAAGAVNLICIQFTAQQKVAAQLGESFHTTPQDRSYAAEKITDILTEIDKILNTREMHDFLAVHPEIAYAVSVTRGSRALVPDRFLTRRSNEDIKRDAEFGDFMFLDLMHNIQSNTEELFPKLDEAIESL